MKAPVRMDSCPMASAAARPNARRAPTPNRLSPPNAAARRAARAAVRARIPRVAADPAALQGASADAR